MGTSGGNPLTLSPSHPLTLSPSHPLTPPPQLLAGGDGQILTTPDGNVITSDGNFLRTQVHLLAQFSPFPNLSFFNMSFRTARS